MAIAIVHHQIVGRKENGEPDLMDLRIRTHGTPGYRSVKRGESNGCHRLHNYVALRLAGFLVKHHENVREGLVPWRLVASCPHFARAVHGIRPPGGVKRATMPWRARCQYRWSGMMLSKAR